MDRITLHRPAADNAGRFCDAGTTMAISDADEANTITEARAGHLVETFGAVEGDATPLPPLDLVDVHPVDHED